MHLLRQGTVPAGRGENTARYVALLIEPDDVFRPSTILRSVRGSCLREKGILKDASSVGGCVQIVLTDIEEARRLLEQTRELPAILRLLRTAMTASHQPRKARP